MGHQRGAKPSGLVVLRTPALPFRVLTDWCAGHEGDPRAEQALRDRLHALLRRPEVDAALRAASPDLHAALERGDRDAEPAALRYVVRMAARPTPFRLFAGWSTGRVGAATVMRVGSRADWRPHTQVDPDALDELVHALLQQPDVRATVRLAPNQTLRRHAGRLRCVQEVRVDGQRRQRLVEVDDGPHVTTALEHAAAGASAPEVAAALTTRGLRPDVARRVVAGLVDAGVLVPDLGVRLTGRPPVEALADELDGFGGPAACTARALRELRDALAVRDRAGVAAAASLDAPVTALLAKLPVALQAHRALQVDVIKPAEVVLDGRRVADMLRAAELLRRMAPPSAPSALDGFRERFVRRYVDEEIPLLDALDEESGVGFSGREGGPSPLLAGLPLGRPAPVSVVFGVREKRLLALLQNSGPEVVLTAEDVAALASAAAPELPAAFAVRSTLSRDGLVAPVVNGPSGASILGRVCQFDPVLAEGVREHLRAEEALDPEAVHAEVVHFPPLTSAAPLVRPALREVELEWLGRSGSRNRLTVKDLLVSVRDDQVVLRSRRLGRRVLPRLTAAHDVALIGTSVYLFLFLLQTQGRAGRLEWSWAPFDGASFLPRVRSGRIVLARARWSTTGDELTTLDSWDGVQAWRARRSLPRWVVLCEGHQRLPVDLDNVVAVDALVQLVRKQQQVHLEELLPGPDELVVDGEDGAYAHEVVVPFTQAAGAVPPPHEPAARAVGGSAGRRMFPPGSAWTCLRLFGGVAVLDRMLRDEVAPIVRGVVADGAAESWFFLRYSDPGTQVRLRVRGPAEQVRPVLDPLVQRLLDDGYATLVVQGTYVREVERYGGPQGVLLAERLFEVDSDAVADLLPLFAPGEAGLDERWRIALLGVERLMEDFGLDDDARARLCAAASARLFQEHAAGSELRRALAARFRRERSALDALLTARPGDEHALAPGIDVLARRSARIAPLAEELRTTPLTVPVDRLAASFVHMWLNRLLRAGTASHELVIHDLLSRWHTARAGRTRGR